MTEQAAFQRVYRAQTAAVGATADGSYAIKVAEAGSIVSCSYTAVAAVTGAASPASRTLNLINKAQDGTGSTNAASLALVGGVNLAAFDEKAVTLSGTAANLVVAAGDVLQFQSLHIGATGLADPGGEVEVVVGRTV